MYVGYVDGEVLFITGRSDGYAIIDGVITQTLNSAAVFDFTLPANSVNAVKIVQKKSIIKVERDGKEIFRGTVSSRQRDMTGNYVFQAEDLIAYMNNVLSNLYTGNYYDTASRLFFYIMQDYNWWVGDEEHKLYIGENTVSVNATLYALGEDELRHTIFDLTRALVQNSGGYIRIRYSDGKAFIDFVPTLDVENRQIIEFGKNIIDIEDLIDSNSVYSRVYVSGKVTLDENGNQQFISIRDINDGKDYVVNSEVEERYGRIEYNMSVDSQDKQVILNTAKSFLATHAGLKSSIKLTAIDLSLLDRDFDAFTMGDNVRVVVPHLNIDSFMLISQINIDLTNPARSKITLGSERDTITSTVSKTATGSAGTLQAAYVVEYGGSDGWFYRHWSDGTMEYWRAVSVEDLPCATPLGTSLLRTGFVNLQQYAYPTAFKTLEDLQITFTTWSGTGAMLWGGAGSDYSLTAPPVQALVRPVGASGNVSGTIYISAKGKIV